MKAQIITGDCVEVMNGMAENSIDAIVTDPPYHLTTGKTGSTGFMGKDWDGGGIAFDPATWREALRLLKPGGYLLAFGGSRTYHRLTCAIEDAGFEVRDEIIYFLSGDRKRDEFLLSLSQRQREIFLEAFGRTNALFWVSGQGFPKSADVSKHLDKSLAIEREIIGMKRSEGGRTTAANTMDRNAGKTNKFDPVTKPVSDVAKQFEGFGSALKPAHEPIVLARKKLIGTIAENVLQYGTGGLNIGACRVALMDGEVTHGSGASQSSAPSTGFGDMKNKRVGVPNVTSTLGRWPANISTDGSEQVLAAFPQTTGGDIKPYERQRRQGNAYGLQPAINTCERKGDSGSAARFFAQCPPDDLNGESRIFYTAKASQSDRNSGLQGERNPHNTVKPQSLCRYLCKLICPPGGAVLDMFAGSGSTGKAAMMEGFDFIGIEQDPAMAEIARHRTTGAAPLFVEMTEAA